MHKDVKRDMLQGLADLKKALPILQAHCPEFGPGPFKLTGEESGDIAGDLDMHAGFDAYQRHRSGMRGIAGRAQRCKGTPFRTFTVRVGRTSGMDTEYKKRLTAIRYKLEGMLTPYWTVQAYLSLDGSIVNSIGLAKTEELYRWIFQREKSGLVFDRKTVGGATFIAPSWDLYRQSGLFFYEYVTASVQAKGRTA
jgi:hypothetical protein